MHPSSEDDQEIEAHLLRFFQPGEDVEEALIIFRQCRRIPRYHAVFQQRVPMLPIRELMRRPQSFFLALRACLQKLSTSTVMSHRPWRKAQNHSNHGLSPTRNLVEHGPGVVFFWFLAIPPPSSPSPLLPQFRQKGRQTQPSNATKFAFSAKVCPVRIINAFVFKIS